MADYYSVLNVPRSATHEEVKRAYHTLSRQIHPDKNAAANGGVEFHQISQAWEILGNVARRRDYDRSLEARQSKSRGVVQDEVDLDDMDFDEPTLTYTFLCRCSGSYTVSEDDLEAGRDIAPCSGCSLKIRILFEEAA